MSVTIVRVADRVPSGTVGLKFTVARLVNVVGFCTVEERTW